MQDARDYADHAGRADIGMDDVRLAVRKKQDALSAGPPTREVRHGIWTGSTSAVKGYKKYVSRMSLLVGRAVPYAMSAVLF